MIHQFHSVYILKRIENRTLNRYLCRYVHSRIIHNSKRWKQLRYPWTDEWINTMWYVHTMEYYSALKMNDILTHAPMWMNLEDIVLHEISQPKSSNII